MGCTTFVTEHEAILIQEGKKIERETNWAVDRLLFDNGLTYTLGLTEDGIVFDESYKSIDIPKYRNCATIQEAIALRLIIDKILEFQPDLVFNGEFALTYDRCDDVHKVKIENNVISTAYEMRTFSEFETFTLPTEEELT